jgi:DnaA regulatory inactivator Hda
MQLVLPLFTPRSHTFDNLVIHEGIQSALSMIRSVYSGDRPLPPLYLYGPSGTGKTHMLKALIRFLQNRFGQRCEFAFIFQSEGSPKLHDLETIVSGMTPDNSICGVAIDDVHLLGTEEKVHLWNLFNKLTRSGNPVLLSALARPADTFGDDPHMESRIAAGLVFELEPPEDNMRLLILDKLAAAKNVRLPREVCNYLVTRKSRNVKELEKVLDIIDYASLQAKRRITIPFIKLLEKDGFL